MWLAPSERMGWISHTCVVGGVVALLVGCTGSAGPPPPAATAQAGSAWFGAYCASCHGASARGDGPVADALDPRPADLTAIASRNGGRFDAEAVAAYIDGRTWIEPHGSSAMPVWGRPIDDRNERILDTETLLTPAAIYQIVEYLRTLQR